MAICPKCKSPIPNSTSHCPGCDTLRGPLPFGAGLQETETAIYDSDADPSWLEALAVAEEEERARAQTAQIPQHHTEKSPQEGARTPQFKEVNTVIHEYRFPLLATEQNNAGPPVGIATAQDLAGEINDLDTKPQGYDLAQLEQASNEESNNIQTKIYEGAIEDLWLGAEADGMRTKPEVLSLRQQQHVGERESPDHYTEAKTTQYPTARHSSSPSTAAASRAEDDDALLDDPTSPVLRARRNKTARQTRDTVREMPIIVGSSGLEGRRDGAGSVDQARSSLAEQEQHSIPEIAPSLIINAAGAEREPTTVPQIFPELIAQSSAAEQTAPQEPPIAETELAATGVDHQPAAGSNEQQGNEQQGTIAATPGAVPQHGGQRIPVLLICFSVGAAIAMVVAFLLRWLL